VLTLGRGLIGLGVGGGLMAALKANVLWWPRARLPLINGLTAAFGSFGALSATVPVEWLLGTIGWRAIFGLLAALTIALAALIFVLVPEKPVIGEPVGTATFRGQMRDLADIFRNGFFWRVATLGCLNNAAFLGYQTLWMGAWLRDVAGMAPPQVAEALLLFNVGMFAGVLCLGAIADRLLRLGVATTVVIAVGVAMSLAVQGAMVLEATGFARLLCVGFGFFGSSVLLNFSLFGQYFPAHIVGRANSAQNMLTFIASFVGQWGVGAIISRWPPLADGRYDPAGHRAALLVLMALEFAALIWFLWPRRATAGWAATERKR
jgi:predicted MFS family arabinose efflux permease